MSRLLQEACKLLKIKKLNTSPYHPQTNGALERSHRTLKEYLRNFVDKDPMNWDNWIPYAMFTYNTTPHSTTLYTPYEIVFGNKAEIPSTFRQNPEPLYNYDNYIYDLKNKMKIASKIARENLIASKERSKSYFDKNVKSVSFQPGDLILLKNEIAVKSNFDKFWLGPYEIINVISPENSEIKINNKLKVVHNNRIKKFHY